MANSTPPLQLHGRSASGTVLERAWPRVHCGPMSAPRQQTFVDVPTWAVCFCSSVDAASPKYPLFRNAPGARQKLAAGVPWFAVQVDLRTHNPLVAGSSPARPTHRLYYVG